MVGNLYQLEVSICLVFFQQSIITRRFFLPTLFSLWIFIKYAKKIPWKNWKILLFLEAISILAGWQSLYWGVGGLHTLDMGFILFPVIAWLRPIIPLPIFYAMTFFIELSGDVWEDAWKFHLAPNWYFGIGGAGFHDGLFLLPLETLIACAVVRYGLLGLSHLLGRTILAEFRDEG